MKAALSNPLENDTNLQQYVSDVGLGQVVVWFDPVVMSKQKTWVISLLVEVVSL
mgnify:CR=1 FL=1